jgi:hypothetical protein
MTRIDVCDGLYILGETQDQMSWTLLEGSMDVVLCRSGHGKVMRKLGLPRAYTLGGGWLIGNKIHFMSGSVHRIPKKLDSYVIDMITNFRMVNYP